MCLHFIRATLNCPLQHPAAGTGMQRGSAGGERCSCPCCAPWGERACFSPFSSCRRNPGGRLGKESCSLLERRGGGSSFIHHPLGRARTRLFLNPLSHVLFTVCWPKGMIFPLVLVSAGCDIEKYTWDDLLYTRLMHPTSSVPLSFMSLQCPAGLSCPAWKYSLYIARIIACVRHPSYDAQCI